MSNFKSGIANFLKKLKRSLFTDEFRENNLLHRIRDIKFISKDRSNLLMIHQL